MYKPPPPTYLLHEKTNITTRTCYTKNTISPHEHTEHVKQEAPERHDDRSKEDISKAREGSNIFMCVTHLQKEQIRRGKLVLGHEPPSSAEVFPTQFSHRALREIRIKCATVLHFEHLKSTRPKREHTSNLRLSRVSRFRRLDYSFSVLFRTMSFAVPHTNKLSTLV